jgi:hypothetical protein
MVEVPQEPSTADPFGLRHLAKLGDAAASVCNNIVDKVSGAVGITYDDLMIVVRARRKAKAMSVLGPVEATVDVHRRTLLARANLQIAAETALQEEALHARARRRIADSIAHQQENIEEITVEAIEHVIELGSAGRVSPPAGKPNDDWMAEFVDMCKNASDSRIRELWGRVLAGEIQNPGSFSIRSLFTLKTLLTSEAEQFRSAANLVLQGEFVYRGNDDEAVSRFGVTYSSFLTLASCGLIAPDANTRWRVGERSGDNVLITYEPYLLLFKSFGTPGPMTLSTWPLTAVGKELARLIEVQHNWDYVKRLVADQETLGWRLDVVLTPVGFPPPSDLPTQARKSD